MRAAFLRSVVFAAAMMTCSLLMSQSSQGTITGIVTDSQGSAVAGVVVTATNVGTNLPFRGTSSTDGSYVIPSVPIGEYEVSAAVSGFKTFRRTGIRVEVAQRLRVDVALEVGEVAEVVEVQAEVPRVQTEDSNLGTVVETKRISELPLNGRHVFNLVKIVAGVQPRLDNTDGFADANNQAFSQIRINGGPAYGNQFFLDGGVNTVPVHNEIAVVPMADAVEEFRVETNALKAEYGQTSGGVINVATKSGTNELRGSLYEFFRNDALDARNAFAVNPDPRTGRIKQVLRYNQYGGTAGGPVYIPKVYNGRNRTFWFAGYEQWKWRSTGAPRLATVATPEQRLGDFSNTRDGQGNLIPIFDPATTRANPNGSGFIRDPFPGNIIPRERMDPLALRLLDYHPLPNVAPTDPFTNANNFLSLAGSSLDQGVTTIRVDHRITQNDSVFFRYTGTRNTRKDAGYGLGVADPSARNDQRDNHSAVFSYTRILSPNTLNEFHAAVSRQWLPFVHPSFDQNWPEQLGFPSIIPQDQFPAINISGLLGISSSSFSAGLRAQQYVQLADSFTMIRGSHTVKTGFDLRWYRLSFINRSRPSGYFEFSSSLTNDPQHPAGTGIGLATFLLGDVSGGNLGYRPFFQYRALPLGAYIQDDWKVTRNFTLNMGLRYDISFGPTEIHDRFSNFNPFLVNPQTGLLGRMVYAGVDAPRSFVNLDKNNVGPRIGFAWNPGGRGKTAIRAGYGLIYTIAEVGHTQGDNSNAFGFSVDTPFVPQGGGPFPAFKLSHGPDFLLQPKGAEGGPGAFRGFNVRYQDRNAPTPYVQHWNFTIQQSLWGGWVASAIYGGSKGTYLFGGNYDLNQLNPSYFSSLGLALQNQVANPFFGQISEGSLSGRRVSQSQLLRPYPDYLNVQTFAANNASSSFHSFQAILEKRFSDGLSALISFTTSKLMTDAFSLGGGGGPSATLEGYRNGLYNRRLDRRVDQDDVSQRLVVSSVYELPVGKGKFFLRDASPVVNAILGGWQINGIGTFQTGKPLMIRGSNNFTGIPFPDLVANPSLPSSERGPNKWFNTDAFRNPADFVIGNAPFTLPSTRGPGLVDVSFSLFKTFSFKERFRLETRWEMFNALNTVNYNDPNVSFSPNRQGKNVNANFGRIFSALDARRMQLGLRLTF